MVRHGVDASFANGNGDGEVVLASECVHSSVAVWPLDGAHDDVLGPFVFGDFRLPIRIWAEQLIPESFATRNAYGQQLLRPLLTATHELIAARAHDVVQGYPNPCYCLCVAYVDEDGAGEDNGMDEVAIAFVRLIELMLM